MGVFPVPPIDMLPTTITGTLGFHTFFEFSLNELILNLTKKENNNESGDNNHNHTLFLYHASKSMPCCVGSSTNDGK